MGRERSPDPLLWNPRGPRGVLEPMRKQPRTLLCGLALLVACGPAVSREAAPKRPAPSGVLWLDTDEGLLAVEVFGGTVRMEMPDAIATRDSSQVYSSRFKN